MILRSSQWASLAFAGIVVLSAGIVLGRQLAHPGTDVGAEYAGQRAHVPEWSRWVNTGDRIGSKTAPVVLLEFGDFQCPACRELALSALRAARAAHPTDLAIVFHHFPMPYHKFALAASHAAECANRQGRFEAFYNLIFEIQDSIGHIPFTAMAGRSGVRDLRAFRACMKDSALDAQIRIDYEQAARDGINSTPSLAINGTMLPSNPDTSELAYYVDEALRARHHEH